MTFAFFLLALQGPWINAAVGVVFSLAAEYVPGFSALSPKWKRAAMFGLCLLIPLLAAVVAVALGYQAAGIDGTWWPAVEAGAIAFGTSQAAHLPSLPSRGQN